MCFVLTYTCFQCIILIAASQYTCMFHGRNLGFFLRNFSKKLCFRVVCPSVRPSEAWNTLIWPVDGSVGPPEQPWPFYGMSVRPSVCPSVRPERFPGICGRTHGGNGLKFYMLMYLDHRQNWLVYGYGLLIVLIFALFWLSETGQIWGFQAFPRERMEEMAWNFESWCILTTIRTN